MSIIDTIIQACSSRPWWENLLKLILFLWLTFVNIIAVRVLPLAIQDRLEISYPRRVGVYVVGIVVMFTYIGLTIFCLLADFFFLVQLF